MTNGERTPLAKPGECAAAKGLAKNSDRNGRGTNRAMNAEALKDVDAAPSKRGRLLPDD